MRKPAGNGRSTGEELRGLAERGHKQAQQDLAGPDVPEVLEYLWRYFLRLDGMRGVDMHGLAPITIEALDAADRLFGWFLDPLEAYAITALDVAIRFPDAGKDEV